MALSDELGNDGLEHRQCSDIRMSLHCFRDDASRMSYGYLIPHEYVHAWNGTFRIPASMVTRDFQETQTTELLWVYEGLTRYLNWVLAARAGIFSMEEARDYVALLAGQQAYRSGREWRSVQDTAISGAILNDSPDEWQSERRGSDYSDEALFIWLEADAIIRHETKGKRSLDDFCRVFFAAPKDSRSIAPYTFEDVTSALNRVAAFNWSEFLRKRLDAVHPDNVPPEGLAASGWNLVYLPEAGTVQVARDKDRHTVEERFSAGLLLQTDGKVIDVVRDSPAWRAGLGPGMKVLGVNHGTWSAQMLRDAVAAADRSNELLVLTIENGSQTWEAELHDVRGSRYPRLKRNDKPDAITDILRPTAATLSRR